MNQRKLKVLAAVVEEYVRTGEPVGSKAIAALPEINASPATIRNDMAVLEQAGYLEQPHTSAGRIPTISGYRLYIEELMSPPGISPEEKRMLDDMLGSRSVMTEELLIQNATTALAELTQCAAVVSDFSPRFSVISKVEVIPTGKRVYVILLITSGGNIKNKACRLEFDLTHEQLGIVSAYLSKHLEGVSVADLSDEMMENLTAAMSAYMMAMSPLIQGICELSRLLDDSFSGIRVLFREDKNSFVIGNSSMIVSKFQKGTKNVGSLGIVGPMRLDYAKVIPYIEYFSQKITDMISENPESEET